MSYAEAIQYCVKAQRLESENKLQQSFIFYREGLAMFMEEIRTDTDSNSKKAMLKLMGQYMEKAEAVKITLRLPNLKLETIEEESVAIKTKVQLT
jgi:aspartate carbamoyltransferase regulatory subunit